MREGEGEGGGESECRREVGGVGSFQSSFYCSLQEVVAVFGARAWGCLGQMWGQQGFRATGEWWAGVSMCS